MFKAVIFDLDGTIADTVESIGTAGNKALEVCGLEPRAYNEYRYFAGDGAEELVRRALKASGDANCIHFKKAMEAYNAFFKEDCVLEVKAYPGIQSVIDCFKELGIKIGVLSNKPHERAVQVVETLFGKAYVDMIVGQQTDVPQKPDPAGALLMAMNFNAKPEECMFVGDTDVDMKTGNGAGMYTVGVLWGFRERSELEKNNAHALVATPRDLVELVV